MVPDHGFPGLLAACFSATLDAGQMTERKSRGRRDLQPFQTLPERGEEVLRILTNLTCDFERFDSIILERRSILEHSGGEPGRDGEVDGKSSLFKQEASEMAMRTQRALEQLRQLAQPVRPRPLRSYRQGVRGPAMGRRTPT